jgi:copper oxidase (laccase) domain-containing protein
MEMLTESSLNQITPELRYRRGRVEAAVFGRRSLEPLARIENPVERMEEEKRILSHYFHLPSDRIIMLDQKHGSDCVRISAADLPSKPLLYAKADALMTMEKDVLLVIRTADCLPLFFHTDAAHEASTDVLIGALHAGWRGLTRGIIAHVMSMAVHTIDRARRMKLAISEQLHIFSGPYIPGRIYEVGPEVARHFPITLPQNSGKFLLDLYHNAQWFLAESLRGRNVEYEDPFGIASGHDNFAERFFSHRHGDKGRNLNVIRILEADHVL